MFKDNPSEASAFTALTGTHQFAYVSVSGDMAVLEKRRHTKNSRPTGHKGGVQSYSRYLYYGEYGLHGKVEDIGVGKVNSLQVTLGDFGCRYGGNKCMD